VNPLQQAPSIVKVTVLVEYPDGKSVKAFYPRVVDFTLSNNPNHRDRSIGLPSTASPLVAVLESVDFHINGTALPDYDNGHEIVRVEKED
jgi:hypothetical protein